MVNSGPGASPGRPSVTRGYAPALLLAALGVCLGPWGAAPTPPILQPGHARVLSPRPQLPFHFWQTGHIFANVVLALAAIPSAAAGPNPPAAAPDLPRTSVVLNLPAADLPAGATPPTLRVVEAECDDVDLRIRVLHPELPTRLQSYVSGTRAILIAKVQAEIESDPARAAGLGVPSGGHLPPTARKAASQGHDLPGAAERTTKEQTNTFSAFDCESNETVFQTLSLLEPATCQLSAQTYRDPKNVSLQVVGRSRLLVVNATVCKMTVTEAVVYCGFDSLHYGEHKLKINYPTYLDYDTCRRAQQTGNLVYDGKTFNVKNGTSESHQWYRYGGMLDTGHDCASTGGFTRSDQYGQERMYTNSYLRIEGTFSLSSVTGTYNPHTKRVVWKNGLATNYGDGVANDHYVGTMIWTVVNPTCHTAMSTLYTGTAQLYKHRLNRAPTFETNDIVLIDNEEMKVHGGFTVQAHLTQCGRRMYHTQTDSVYLLHVRPGEAPVTVGDSVMQDIKHVNAALGQSFHHLKSNLHGSNALTTVVQSLCQHERRLLSVLAAMAAAENEYSFYSLYGPGYTLLRAGAALYVGQCPIIKATIRQPSNCTQEIPATAQDGREIFVDAITRNLRSIPTYTACDVVSPVTYHIANRWICSSPELRDCQAPLSLEPRTDDLSGEQLSYDFAKGVGAHAISPYAYMTHINKLHEQHARNPVLADLGHRFANYYHPPPILNPDGTVTAHKSWGSISPYMSRESLSQITDHVGGRLTAFYSLLGQDAGKFFTGLFLFWCISAMAMMIARFFYTYAHDGCGRSLLLSTCSNSIFLATLPVRPLMSLWRMFPDYNDDPNGPNYTLGMVSPGEYKRMVRQYREARKGQGDPLCMWLKAMCSCGDGPSRRLTERDSDEDPMLRMRPTYTGTRPKHSDPDAAQDPSCGHYEGSRDPQRRGAPRDTIVSPPNRSGSPPPPDYSAEYPGRPELDAAGAETAALPQHQHALIHQGIGHGYHDPRSQGGVPREQHVPSHGGVEGQIGAGAFETPHTTY